MQPATENKAAIEDKHVVVMEHPSVRIVQLDYPLRGQGCRPARSGSTRLAGAVFETSR